MMIAVCGVAFRNVLSNSKMDEKYLCAEYVRVVFFFMTTVPSKYKVC
jgi:hypothetical protein